MKLAELKKQFTKQELWRRYKQELIDLTLSMLDMTLWDKQNDIIRSDANLKLIRGARRTAKSWNPAVLTYTALLFGAIFDYEMHIRFGAPRFEDTGHMWFYFNKFWDVSPLCEEFSSLKIAYSNLESHSTHKKEMQFENRSWIKTASCEEPEMKGIRGDWHDFIAIDEYGLVAHKELTIDAMMYSLKDQGPLNMGMIFGTAAVTLDLGQTFARLFELGQGDDSKIQSWHLDEDDNPYQDEAATLVARKVVTDEGYLREGRGEDIPIGGRMFNVFDSRECVQDLQYNPNEDLIVGIDFGYNKPVAIFMQYYEQTLRALMELSPKKILIPDFCMEIAIVLEAIFGGRLPDVIGCDPAGDAHNDKVSFTSFAILKKMFPNAVFTHMPALTSKANQIMMLRSLMMGGRFLVDKSCIRLISAIVNAAPDISLRTGAINSAGWRKIKGIDDPLDAICYGLINYEPTAQFCMIGSRKRQGFNDLQLAEIRGLI